MGAAHVKVTCVWLVFAASFATDWGASGTVAISAQLPTADSGDSPIAFVAVIFAQTEAVFGKLKGAVEKTDFGMVQLLFVTIVDWEPSQLPSSFT